MFRTSSSLAIRPRRVVDDSEDGVTSFDSFVSVVSAGVVGKPSITLGVDEEVEAGGTTEEEDGDDGDDSGAVVLVLRDG